MNQTIHALCILGLIGTSACGGKATTKTPKALLAALGTSTTLIVGMKLNSTPTLASVPGLGGNAPLNASFAVDPCAAVVTPSSTTDADTDGIPLTARGVYRCTNRVDSEGNTSTWDGIYEITDKDDTKKYSEGGWKYLWDFRSKNSFVAIGDFKGGTFDYNGKGAYDLTKTGATETYTGAYSGQVAFTVVGGKPGSYTYDGTWKNTYTSTSSPSYLRGSATIAGVWHIVGTLPDEENQGKAREALDAEITFSSKNLTYDSTCGAWFKTGSVFFTDVDGAALEYRYNCNTFEYYYNGKLYDPAEDNS